MTKKSGPSTAEAMTAPPGDAAAKPSSSLTQTAEEFTNKVWMPLLACCVYVVFLRLWYVNFKHANGASPSSSVFGDVWWSAPIAASLIYLAVIFGIKAYLKDKKPCQIKDLMFAYNLYQTILNIWCVFAFIKEVYVQGMSVWGSAVDTSPSGFRLGFLIWVHYNNKYVELLDTVFMALRKKDNQISFLHVYHHILLIWSWFLVCKFGCGGDAYFGALCNSFIHVLMYGYYLLALLKVNTPWKKHLTSLQMLQFVVCFAHAIYVAYLGLYPRWLTFLQMWVMSNMLVLFGNFYRKTYSAKQSKDKALKDAAKEKGA